MSKYKKHLKDKLSKYYDLKDNVKIGNMSFDFQATFNQRNAKYFLLKELEYYSFKNNEYIFFKNINNDIDFSNFDLLLKNHLKDIVDIEENHMSSVITFLIEKPFPIDKTIIKKIKKYKFHKSFKFGLKGWVNVRFIVVNSNGNKGYSNRFGKKELNKFLIK